MNVANASFIRTLNAQQLPPSREQHSLTPQGISEGLATSQGFGTHIDLSSKSIQVITDGIRSTPVYWRAQGANLQLAANIDDLDPATLALDPQGVFELLYFGYVLGNRTLFSDVYCTPAGSSTVLYWAGDQWESRHTINTDDPPGWFHESRGIGNTGFDSAGFVAAHMKTTAAIFQALPGRPVIPLSGGRDSTLLACSIRELGAKHVLCYTYGAANDPEVVASKANAAALGFEWVRVPYHEELWRRVSEGDAWREYVATGGGGVSIAHVQDWPAVQWLGQQGLLENGDTFMPGHSGDFVAGSHLRPAPRWPVEPRRWALREVNRIHGGVTRWDAIKKYVPNPETALARAESTLRIEMAIWADFRRANVNSWLDSWDWQNRQAKFIANSVTAYSGAGYAWCLPQWSRTYRDFWRACPANLRLNTRLYRDATDPVLQRWGMQLAQSRISVLPAPLQREIKHLGAILARHIPRLAAGKSESFGWLAVSADNDANQAEPSGLNSLIGQLTLNLIRERSNR